MTDDEKRFTQYQIAISLVTLVLTPLLAGFVVSYQLGREQRIWLEQQTFERYEAYLDRKLSLMEDINTRILRLEVAAKKIKQDQSLVASKYALQASTGFKYDEQSEDFDKLLNDIVQYHYDLFELGSRTQTAVLFFDPDVQQALNRLLQSLEKNYAASPDYFDQIREFVSNPENVGPIEALTIAEEANIESLEELTQARLEVIKLMSEDIQRSHEMYAERGN